MKIRKPLRFILLGACLIHSLAMAADTQPTNTDNRPNAEISVVSKDDLNAQKELFQFQLDAKKELLQKDIEAQSKRIDAFEKRIDDQTNRISDISASVDKFGIIAGILGTLTTALLVWIGVVGYKAAKSDARETAKEMSEQTAEKWFETHHKDLISRMEELEISVARAIERIAGYEANVQQISSDAKDKMKATTEEFEARLQIEMQNIQNRLLESRESGQSENQLPKDNSAIEQRADQLKQLPESEYTFSDWNTRAFAAYSEGKLDDAIFYWDKAIASSDIQSQVQAQTMYNKSVALAMLNRDEEAITVYDAIITQFGVTEELSLRETVAKTMVNKGFTLGQLNRGEAEIAVYDEIITQFGAAEELNLREQIAKAMVNKGFTLGQLSRGEEAIAACDAVITIFGAAEELNLREPVAMAMVNKGFILDQLNRGKEAIAAFDAVITIFGTAEELKLREQVAMAMVNKGFTLSQLNRNEEAIAVYDAVITNFSTAKELSLREQVAKTMVNKGFALSQLNRNEEAIAVYDAVITNFNTAEELSLREQVADAMANKGFALGQLNRNEEAIAAYDAVITNCGTNEELSMVEPVINAWNGKGFSLLCMAKANWENVALATEQLVSANNACVSAISKNPYFGTAYGNLAYITWLQGDAVAAEQHFRTGLASAKEGGEVLYKGTLADFEIHPIAPDQGFKELVERLWEEYRQTHKS